jgi:phytoene synthase
LAFQLTNIIRDVSSDYAMGRVYLPEEDLRRFGVWSEELAGKTITPALRELLRFEAERAWHFYQEGAELISLVEPESRAALWGLVRTYSTLLGRIEGHGYDVGSRVRLSFADKMYIWGFARLGRCTQTNVFEKRDSDRRGIGRLVGGRRAG